MKIKKQINNPHRLYKQLSKQFDFDAGISTDSENVELHNLPEEIDPELLKNYIENWTDEKTDSEEIAEEQSEADEEKILRLLEKFIDSKNLNTEAVKRITKIKAKDEAAKVKKSSKSS